MKKQLIALSLVATSGLLADGATNTAPKEQSGCCNNCFCSPCCCNSCTPKPKKCIDSEAYTPQYYDLQCDWGVFVDVEFLYWYSREKNLSYGLEVVGVTPVASPEELTTVFSFPKSYKDLKASWDPGVRIGIGLNSECDGWDYYFSWTYLHSSKTQTSSGHPGATDPTIFTAGETLILNPWVESAFFETPFFDKVKAKWDLRLNIFDLEIGRRYWLSKCFTLRPYVGIRGAWTETNFELFSTIGPISDFFENQSESSTDKYNNEVWGVGLLGGFQPSWHFTPCFSFFGNVSVSALWGDFKSDKKTVIKIVGEVGETEFAIVGLNQADRDTSKMQALIDLGIGFRWEDTWCCDRYRTSVDLGWEHHMWINHGAYSRTIGQGGGPFNPLATTPQSIYPTSYVNNVTDLGYGGIVIRARFDF